MKRRKLVVKVTPKKWKAEKEFIKPSCVNE
jgi:hypothetical protein